MAVTRQPVRLAAYSDSAPHPHPIWRTHRQDENQMEAHSGWRGKGLSSVAFTGRERGTVHRTARNQSAVRARSNNRSPGPEQEDFIGKTTRYLEDVVGGADARLADERLQLVHLRLWSSAQEGIRCRMVAGDTTREGRSAHNAHASQQTANRSGPRGRQTAARQPHDRLHDRPKRNQDKSTGN